MNPSGVSELINKFKSYSFDPPSEYVWALRHKMLGFEPFTQFEPWYFCDVSEMGTLSEDWPEIKTEREYFTFARRQDMEELACFEYENGKVTAVCVIHYSLRSPVSWEIVRRYNTFWEWMKGVVDDAAQWSRIMTERKQEPQ